MDVQLSATSDEVRISATVNVKVGAFTVRIQTKANSTPSRMSAGASLGSSYSNKAPSNPTITSQGKTIISPDATLVAGGLSQTPSSELSETMNAPAILKPTPVKVIVSNVASSSHLLKKLIAMSDEQFTYNSFVKLVGSSQANYIANKFGWRVTPQTY